MTTKPQDGCLIYFMFLVSVIWAYLSSNHPSFQRGMKLCEASCMLILGNPLCVFHPVPLFNLADGEQDVRFTPAEKNGGKLRHKMDMAVNSRFVSPEKRDKWWKENKQGEADYFSKSCTEVSNYIHSETCNLRWDTQPHTDTHSHSVAEP